MADSEAVSSFCSHSLRPVFFITSRGAVPAPAMAFSQVRDS